MKLQIPFSTPANIGLRQSKTRASKTSFTHTIRLLIWCSCFMSARTCFFECALVLAFFFRIFWAFGIPNWTVVDTYTHKGSGGWTDKLHMHEDNCTEHMLIVLTKFWITFSLSLFLSLSRLYFMLCCANVGYKRKCCTLVYHLMYFYFTYVFTGNDWLNASHSILFCFCLARRDRMRPHRM